MILIKLGGSIITNKERPLSPRKRTIDNILKEIGKIKEPIIIVHGGGSYGHYWSVKYDMHTKPGKTAPKGVAIVKNSMVELNKIILASRKEGMTIVPITLYFNNKGIAKLTIGLAKGKKKQDKRASIKEKEWGIKKQRLVKNGIIF